MKRRDLLSLSVASALTTACGGAGTSLGLQNAARNSYLQTNLAATNASYQAKFTFPEMVNAWGIAIRPSGQGGHFWVTGGGTSWQFVGDVTASSDPKLQTLFQDDLAKVFLPGADSLSSKDSKGKATGTAFNGAPLTSNLFKVTQQTATRADGSTVRFDGSARFVFATDSGTLSAWTDRAADGSVVRINGPSQLVFDGGAQGMAFFGIAIKPNTYDTLWAADFGADPQIRQFDSTWSLVPTRGFANPFATGELRDAANPSAGKKAKPGDPVAFNIHALGNRIFVMYCMSQALRNQSGQVIDVNQFFAAEEDALNTEDEAKAGARPGKGKLVEYTVNGELVRVYEDDDRLNAPWGIALAPNNFGALSNHLLVGNFGGAGKIAAFDQTTGRFVDFIRNERNEVIGIPGLWALMFGNGASLGDSNALYFAAGPEDEAAGLFGSLRLTK